MTARNIVALLIENGCKAHLCDDDFIKTAVQYTSPKKKSKKKSSLPLEADICLYSKNMIVIRRTDIELKERMNNNENEENKELKWCLEDYHINNLNDFIENKLDDLNEIDQEQSIYVLFHEICDNIDDIKKLSDNNFEIRGFIYISDKETEKEKEKEKEKEIKNESQENDINEECAENEENMDENEKIDISNKIIKHFMDETNYEKYECLNNIIIHKMEGWKIITNRKGNNNIRYKDMIEICQELRIYIHQIQNEWNLYDTNWRNEKLVNNTNEEKEENINYKIPIIEIPEIKLKDINEYKTYNKYMNNIKSPNISSILSAMIDEIAITKNEEEKEDNNDDIVDVTIPNEDESGVYRFGDIISQNNYLNNICVEEIESNKNILIKFSKWFIDSLFADNQINENLFESQTTARYTFSKLNPSTFDDALIYNYFNKLLISQQQQPINDRIFREDLNEMELIQCIQNLISNPFIKCKKQYINFMDIVLLMYYIDIPLKKPYQQSNIDVFLSSNIGFRKWLKLPQKLKNIKPNAFYPYNHNLKESQFLYKNSIIIYPQNNWFMGLSSFDFESNTMNKPYLWLRDDQNSVISISKNIEENNNKSIHFNVHFADNAQLTFTSKSMSNNTINTENKTDENEENIENVDQENEIKEETIITPQNNNNNKKDIIYISLPNEISIEYHYKTGHLIMYYQSALNKYKQNQIKQQQQQNESNTTDKVSNPDHDENEANKEDENEANKENENVINNEENTDELEAIDVSWNNNNDIFIVWRVIDNEGIITINYSDDSQRKLFPNSEIWYKSSINSKWIIIKSNGECQIDKEIKKSINIATTTDSDTNTKIVTREDNVLVFCHLNGDGFIQYPDSTHIFVKSNISKKEWDIHQLSQWMQSMGVDKQSSFEISNLSENIINETAEKLKNDLIEIKFELKNDYKIPTIIIDKINKTTKVIFYNGFNAIFNHSNNTENVISTINHIDTGKFIIYNNIENNIHFIPKNNIIDNESEFGIYKIDLNEENPSILVKDKENNEMWIALNGEYKTDLNDRINNEIEARLFVVYRDGTGYELLSNDTIKKFRKYLFSYSPKPQILEPKPLLLSSSKINNNPLSHRFIIERFANNAPRQEINIPSVLCNTLNTKINKYSNNDINKSCHIYRHLLETSIITNKEIETAENDLLNFENWLKSNDNKIKLENNDEINEINKEIIEQKNKLKQEFNLSPLELKMTLSSELEREKLNALNRELQKNEKNQEIDDEENNKEKEEEIKKNKENKMKAKEIKNIQQKNKEKLKKSDKENLVYFENEPFLRDYEINQNLLGIFNYFIKIWNEYEYNEENDKLFIDTLSLLKILCSRLREIISIKTLNINLKILSLNEDIMIKIIKNEFITKNIHNLLCCIGFRLSLKTDNGYIPEQSNIFIDGGICNILSKLDEFHSKYKQYLFEINNKNIEYIKSFEMDLKTKIIDKETETFNKYQQYKKKMNINNNNNNHNESAIDKPYFPSSPSYSIITDYEEKPEMTRCLSHCSCCPPNSPLRATKMDYLGRNRNHIISMDDLENYPKSVSNKQLNKKYIETEGSVQRRVRTSSTFNKNLIFSDAFPNVIIQPNIIDFGNILIGYIYRFTATITNHGNNQARFKIDILNNNNNDDIHIKTYYRSGGIAPGITIMLQVELCSKTFVGKYTNNICIKTQKNIFNVDIKANIQQNINNNNNNKKSRVTCLGKKY